MKKLLLIILMLGLVTNICACDKAETQVNSDRIKIITTVFPPFDFARNVTGDRAEVTQLLYPGAESHSYEPTPLDIIKIKESDLFIYGGGESDTWIRSTLLSGELEGVNALAMTDAVSLLREESGEHEEEHSEYDEHVWTSLKNAALICNEICDALCKIDPENSEFYKENTEKYTKKLLNLDSEYKEMISAAKRKTLVFGDRFPFLYLARDYGLKYFAAFSGCASDTEPSAATISFLMNKVKEEKIPAVFYIEFSSQNIADIICESTGAKKLLLHSCHNVTEEEKKAGVSYLGLMEQNLENLTEALN